MIVPTLRESLQQVMEWLDAEEVRVVNLQRAHDVLLELVQQQTPPQQAMAFSERTRTQLTTEPTMFADWLDDQSDLYRCIILSSFLLLQLMERIPEFALLQDSIERALLVLRVLYNASDDVALSNFILESRYPLLNALFQEPLLPLSKAERTQLWDDTVEPISIQDVDGDTGTSEVIVISPKELLREENQLLDMAEREIPNNVNHTSSIPSEPFIYEPTFQGKVFCCTGAEGEETIPKRKHRLRIYPNGFMALSVSYSAVPQLYMLGPTTTMTHCITKEQKLHIELENPNLAFHVDHATLGMQWMRAIKEAISASQVAADLKKELEALMG
jgi:hypothetical protein